MSHFYTGIGSRKTPPEVCDLITKLAVRLRIGGMMLRSGRAPGADQAFELGANPFMQIFLPWRTFEIEWAMNNSSPPNIGGGMMLPSPTVDAYQLARKFHPAWNHLSTGARALHARNMHQVLGENLDTPSRFIICWTEDGKEKGGTAQALRAARHFRIPIYNLGNYRDLFILKTWLDSGTSPQAIFQTVHLSI